MSNLFTTKQVASALGVNASRVRQLILSGKLRAEKHGRDWMITKEEVHRFMRERYRLKTIPIPVTTKITLPE